MSFISRARSFLGQKATLDQLRELMFSGGVAQSGTVVNDRTALQVSVVLACLRVISEGVAQSDLDVVTDKDGIPVPMPTHKYARLLMRRPCEFLDAFSFREFLTASAAATGNGYALITRKESGEIAELLPLHPSWVSVRQAASWDFIYQISVPLGGFIERRAADVLHLRGPMYNQLERGDNVISLAREAIGLSLAAEGTHASFHRNGGRPTGIISVDGKLSADSAKAMMAAIAARLTNPGIQGGSLLLDNGAKYTPITMTGVDAQHIEMRRFEIEEICRFFNVFPAAVMQSQGAVAYASVEAYFTQHVRQTIRPWLRRWEMAYDVVFRGDEKFRAQFDTHALTEASLVDRGNFYNQAVMNGIYTPNDARRRERLPPLPGGDKPRRPVNMTTLPETGQTGGTGNA